MRSQDHFQQVLLYFMVFRHLFSGSTATRQTLSVYWAFQSCEKEIITPTDLKPRGKPILHRITVTMLHSDYSNSLGRSVFCRYCIGMNKKLISGITMNKVGRFHPRRSLGNLGQSHCVL
jgi:hypothetical protein